MSVDMTPTIITIAQRPVSQRLNASRTSSVPCVWHCYSGKQICEMFYENERNSPQIYADSVTLINAGKQSEFSYQLSVFSFQFSVLLLGRSLIAEN